MTSKKINIKINNQKIEAKTGESILEVAKRNDIFIPSLCHHPDFKAEANCRVCVVEVKGWPKLLTACSTPVWKDMEVITDSEKVKKARNLNMELIFAEHIEKCPECIWRINCTLLSLAERYKLSIKKFVDRKSKRKIYKFGNAVEIDSSQCIDCRTCVDACSLMQNINYLEIKGKGANQEIKPTTKKDIDCIYCGQCAAHCPVGAAQEQSDWDKVEKNLKNKKKIMVAQFAPSVRVSIGEAFGMKYGQVATEKLVSSLRGLGFDYVFDVNFGADVTTVVEAGELLERVASKTRENKKVAWPMITSCCPAWVKYVEYYHPEIIPNLTTSRSPQIHLGGIIKTYWAKQMNVKASDIMVVSVMPCTAKKFEISRKELKINNVFPVDYVVTTRELAWLIKKNKIDFANLKGSKADNPLGEHTGASVIYGGSGGVMESALRTAHALACGDKKTGLCLPQIDFKEVRGCKGVKESLVNVAGKKFRIAIVNGIGNVESVLENLENYDYIEVMACPGGCIGGGGQPYPTTDEIRKKRVEALYKIDKNKKIRKAHENVNVKKVLAWLKEQGKKTDHQVLHTSYKGLSSNTRFG